VTEARFREIRVRRRGRPATVADVGDGRRTLREIVPMNHRYPTTTRSRGPHAPADAAPRRPERAPALARRENDEMRHALIRSQVELAAANAILVALVAAYQGRPDESVPAYVREARAHLGSRH
jgi:hypothetical protein